MTYDFVSTPSEWLSGECILPGDKSISHRALVFGAIAEGETKVEGFLNGEDCLASLNAFRAMGVGIDFNKDNEFTIKGVGKYGLKKPLTMIDCGNSGTTMRLLAGLLAAQPFDSILTGDQSLLKRPMTRITLPLSKMGAEILSEGGKAPLRINKSKGLQGIDYVLPEASAQVKSCLLLAGLYAKGETRLTEKSKTRDHSEKMLEAFSYPLKIKDHQLVINSEAKLIGTLIQVPGDFSSAAFFIVAAILSPNASILLKNVGVNPTRTGLITILKEMGAKIDLVNFRYYGNEPVADIWVESSPLKGIKIREELVSLSIDEFPILFIAASSAQGKTIISGAKELRTKESDRITAMVEGLKSLGIKAIATEDGAEIEGGNIQGGEVDSYHDHRIAMAFAIAGSIAQNEVIIRQCDNVATSFPTFIETSKQLNLFIRERHAK